MRKLFHLLCAFLLCLQLCGGHLGMLQVVAWSGMMVSYAQTDGVVEAARKTFDGEHKCNLCHAIDASRDGAQKDPANSKSPPAEWSKFGKELLTEWNVRGPVRLDGLAQQLKVAEPAWLWPTDPANPPSPPPRLA